MYRITCLSQTRNDGLSLPYLVGLKLNVEINDMHKEFSINAIADLNC